MTSKLRPGETQPSEKRHQRKLHNKKVRPVIPSGCPMARWWDRVTAVFGISQPAQLHSTAHAPRNGPFGHQNGKTQSQQRPKPSFQALLPSPPSAGFAMLIPVEVTGKFGRTCPRTSKCRFVVILAPFGPGGIFPEGFSKCPAPVERQLQEHVRRLGIEPSHPVNQRKLRNKNLWPVVPWLPFPAFHLPTHPYTHTHTHTPTPRHLFWDGVIPIQRFPS